MRTKNLLIPKSAMRLLSGAFFLVALAMLGCTGTAPTASPALPAAPTESPTTPGDLGDPISSLPPTATVTPVPAEIPTRVPVPGLPSDILEGHDQWGEASSAYSDDTPFPPAPDRDLYQLAARLSLKTDPNQIPRVVNSAPVSYSAGRQDTFWLVDFRDMKVYQSDFELRLVSPNAYWYVEKGQPVLQRDLEQAAREYEDRIYPQVTASFGREWTPGVDNDPHLNIVHAALQGVAGYYSSTDQHPQSVNLYSNERETIYINTRSLSVGKQSYLEVLAHELQHAVHWNHDPSEDTWVNEGLSELAVSVAGYRSASFRRYLRTPTVSIIHWPLDNDNISAHYGGASLFMHYLSEHYSQDGNMQDLVREPANGIAGINAYLAGRGYSAGFRDVFRDWVIANVLDEDQGHYGYGDLEVDATVTRTIDHFSQLQSEIPQYSVEYVQLESLAGPIRIRFEGATEARLLPVDVDDRGCWWSNSGDSISSTLTSAIELRDQSRATLTYQVWHGTEEDWDYGYLQVSVDGGQTWQILETLNTTPENPIGNSFGPGYTGHSHGWITERVNLSQFTGREVLLRFHYITDDAVNGAGMCLRSMEIPEAGLLEGDLDWQAEGFVLTNNRVKQDYMVQVIQFGEANQVFAIGLDANNRGQIEIPASHNLERVVVVVAALAPKTLQEAPYTLIVEPGS